MKLAKNEDIVPLERARKELEHRPQGDTAKAIPALHES